jgi:hypothetical protein
MRQSERDKITLKKKEREKRIASAGGISEPIFFVVVNEVEKHIG